jgi:hypothetical protein
MTRSGWEGIFPARSDKTVSLVDARLGTDAFRARNEEGRSKKKAEKKTEELEETRGGLMVGRRG